MTSKKRAAPARDQLRAVSEDLTRFVRDNVANPERALADMQSIKNDQAPPREVVNTQDLLRQPGDQRGLRSAFDQGPGVTEVNGPAYAGPSDVRRYSRAASPAPAVSTSHPANHTYASATTGKRVVFLPAGVGHPDAEAQAS